MGRRKPKSLLGLLFCMGSDAAKGVHKAAKSYRPYNSRGAKISRAKKKKWF